MKKIGTLNRHLSCVIASMGHSDKLVICDSGLPLPPDREIVDLALTKNIPRFCETVEVVLEELEVESAVVAEEIKEHNPSTLESLRALLGTTKIIFVPHEQFKELTTRDGNIAFVRTGEASPFSNVLLNAGVTF